MRQILATIMVGGVVLAMAPASFAMTDDGPSATKVTPEEIAEEAKVFINARHKIVYSTEDSSTDDGSTVHVTVMPSPIKFGDLWTFERKVEHIGSIGSGYWWVSETKTTLDPKLLSVPVTVDTTDGVFQIELECHMGECIEIDGWDESKSSPPVVPGRQHSKELAVSVFLRFETENDAVRVGKAFEYLLNAAGAKKRHF